MKYYTDSNNDSNIRAYDYSDEYIIIEFKDGSQYKYTYGSAGSHNIEKMKRLADYGDGLNSFINKNRPGFATKY